MYLFKLQNLKMYFSYPIVNVFFHHCRIRSPFSLNCIWRIFWISKCICSNHKNEVVQTQNVFFKIAKCLCSNLKNVFVWLWLLYFISSLQDPLSPFSLNCMKGLFLSLNQANAHLMLHLCTLVSFVLLVTNNIFIFFISI